MYWQTSNRRISLERPLVMAILNVTPDSFSDGGSVVTLDDAIRKAKKLIEEGAEILDIGGESTRPGSSRISVDEELDRVVPVIEAISGRFDIPISIDTSRSEVASAAIGSGAEIINDISGLRWDEDIAGIAAAEGCGLILMHSRGEFESMHSQEPVEDILAEVSRGFSRAVQVANEHGIGGDQIVLDIGIGFGKTFEQNLELLAKLGRIVDEFKAYPMLMGTSRKSFIGKILGDAPPSERLGGSLASALFAVDRGASIIRVHDVRGTVAAISVWRRLSEA